MNGAEHTTDLPDTLFRIGGAAPRGTLIFLPDLGGNVLYAKPLVAELSDNFNCIGVRLGREISAQLGQHSVPDLGERFASDIAQADLPRPIHLAGFSFAGYLAYETARHLQSGGHGFDRLWLFDTRVARYLRDSRLLRAPVAELSYAARYFAKNWRKVLGLRPDPDFLCGFGLIELDTSGYSEGHRAIVRAMYHALEAYRPSSWQGGAATLLRAVDEPTNVDAEPDLGWGRLIDNGLDVHELAGDHLGLLKSPASVAAIATAMREAADG
ncbi:thioesterase domain-containing protein [Aliiroseovarius sp. YM-037]|uniref:thioesterase domain-containing protein n=1 Tax=Aliiroseovarius sp. YM-037 TaxID=3341728 RepID=UPI003A8053F7